MTDIKELILALRCSITAKTKEDELNCIKCKYHLLERIDNDPAFAGAKPDALIDGVPLLCEL